MGSDIAITESRDLVNDGNINLMGMQIKISDIIGDKLVDQFMATISPEQMDSITKAFFNEVFEEVTATEYDTSDGKYKDIKSVKFKKDIYTGHWNSRNDTPVYARAKATIKQRYTDMIENKILEYMTSEEYQKKAEGIAKEIADYALEGYKEDVIKSVRERLVEPVVQPNYPYVNIREVVRQEIKAICNNSEIQYY